MAATEEEKKIDLKDRSLRLVDSKFGGDWDRAFAYYAGKNNSDFTINKDELRLFLSDAGIVDWIDQAKWCDQLMKEKEKDSTNSSDNKFEKRGFLEMFRR